MSIDERWMQALCLTILFCISIGVALHSWVGVCVGICMGVPFGLFGAEKDDEYEDQGREDR